MNSEKSKPKNKRGFREFINQSLFQKSADYSRVYNYLPVKLLHDNKVMMEYAVNNGIKIQSWIGKYIGEADTKTADIVSKISQMEPEESVELEKEASKLISGCTAKLTEAHSMLSSCVAPATPLTIEYTKPRARFFTGEKTTIPIIRNMWIFSIIFLTGFIISFSQNQSHTDWIWKSLQMFFSAGLGAYFYALYTANKYFVARTFDPKYNTFYNNRIIIGIIAGFILANIIDPESISGQNNTLAKLTPSMIALLGGYSADAVNKILNRIVAMLTALVQGDIKETLSIKESEWKIKIVEAETKSKIFAAAGLIKILNSQRPDLSEETFRKLMDYVTRLTVPPETADNLQSGEGDK